MKTICQECGKELSSWGEMHTYQMCGNYHLQRAEEILGFSLRNMEIYKTELEKWKHNWNLEAVKIEKTLEVLDEIDAELKKSPQPQDMNVRISAILFYRLRDILASNNRKETEVKE
jgi:hypothetical protein